MSAPTTNRRLGAFFGVFLLVALLLAGVVSYAASGSPDGLDAVTQSGCESVGTADGEHLQGTCIAQHAGEHASAGSPFADYAVGGNDALTGVAGVVGVIATLLLAGGLFRLLRRRHAPDDEAG
ncbi:PDGLE domain-containing protein [Actinomycetospora endophytica]|uniref:PDGLE domain-containing protein n=1 Tax=Actinomycetospora endophytica TaxID=2291215 RepID=A0ABS8P6P0_9PSEU|nr:PDGLE domain-containing protein [Actinomycetospora endophytica]MCD2193915.1 PDGLE domain-containing protein [Actinomycetospora endophytica]